MSFPSLNRLFVQSSCLLSRLRSSFISVIIELFSSLSCRDQMDHSIVPIISQLNTTGPQLVQHCLPYFRMTISFIIQRPSVTDNHGILLLPCRDLEEQVLQMNLVLNNSQLQLDLLADVRRGHQRYPCFHHDGRCLRKCVYLVASVGQPGLHHGQRGALACTGAAGQSDPVNVLGIAEA